MSEIESIFNPKDNSLSERVSALFSVVRAFRLAYKNLELIESAEEIEYLGSKDDVKNAYNAISKDFSYANQQVSADDLVEARKLNLLEDSEFLDIVEMQRIQKMKNARNDLMSRSDDLNLKR